MAQRGVASIIVKARERQHMDYDVEADWLLLYTSNYRCTYFFFSAETLSEKLKVFRRVLCSGNGCSENQ